MEQGLNSLLTVLGVINPLLTFALLIVGIGLIFYLKGKLEVYFTNMEDISVSLKIISREKTDISNYNDWKR